MDHARGTRGIVVALLAAVSLGAGVLGSAEDEPAANIGRKIRWDLALTAPGEPGTPYVIEGRVMSMPDSTPIRGATLHVYHADAKGLYSAEGEKNPRLAGTLRTNIAGGFRIRTILPGMYDGLPHVHFKLAGPGFEERTGSLTLCRNHGAGSDSAYAKLPWMLTLPSTGEWVHVEPDAEHGFRSRWSLYVDRRPE